MKPCLYVLFALSLVSGVIEAAPPNLVPNSSCELGASAGQLPECWKVWMQQPGSAQAGADAAGAKYGTWSLKIANPGTGGANTTTAEVPCAPNARYTLSVYVRSQDAVRSQVTLIAKDTEGKVLSWGLGGGQTVPATADWVRLSHTVTTPPTCASLTPHLTNNGGTTWWDACQLEPGDAATAYVDSVPPVPPELAALVPGVNLVPNPGFEEDLAATGWQAFVPSGDSTGRTTWDTTSTHTGTHALKIEAVTQSRRWQSRLLPLDPASSYRLSAWLRTVGLEGRADVYLDCYGRWLTPIGRAGYDGGVYAYEDCAWTERYAMIQPRDIPRAAVYARVVCEVTGTVHATGEAWFDDLTLTMAPATLDLQPAAAAARLAASIVRPDEAITYELSVHVPGAAQAPLSARFTVADYFGVEHASGVVPVVCDAQGNATVRLDVPALHATGYFALAVDLQRGGETLGSGSESFGVTSFDPGQWAPDERSRFGICHIRDERMYPLAQIAGMKWTRGGSNPSWPAVQPEEERWTWSSFDRAWAQAEPFGIHKLIILSGIPAWASQGEDEFFIFFRRPANKRFLRLPGDLADFEAYVYETVNRYKAKLSYWEVWNEADIAFWQGTDEEYIQLLQAAYRGAKRADPACQVSMTGLAYPFPHTHPSGRLYDGRGFLEKCLKLAPNEFDIVNFHSYGGLAPLERKLREIDELMRQYRCTKPVWITETGAATHRRGVSEQEQARYCAQAHAAAFAAGVAKVFWHCFYDWGVDPNYNEHHFGLIHYDYSPKPAYMVYCAMTRELAGTGAATTVDLGPGIRAVSFQRGTDPVTMLWSEQGEQSVLLRLDAGQAVLADLMGNPRPVNAPLQALPLTLTPDPVYLKGARVLSRLGPVVQLQDGLMLCPGETVSATLTLSNVLGTAVDGEYALSVPAGWTVTPERASFELAAGGARSQPLRLTAPSTLAVGRAAIICDVRLGALALPRLSAGHVVLAVPVPSGPAEIRVDGDLAEWPPGGALAIDAPGRVVHGACGGGADVSARFWLAGDREALFVALAVRDEWVANLRRYSEPWNGDAVELFLDLRPPARLGEATHSAGVYQFFLIPPDETTGRATWRLWQPKSPFSSALDLAGARSADGYTLEARLPWCSFGPHAPAPGQPIGIDVCIDDADAASPAVREAQLAWAGTARNHVDASGFARGLLAAAPASITSRCDEPVNLAPNPGFEADLDGDGAISVADGWRGVTADWGDTTGSWIWDRSVAHEGRGSVAIRGVTTHRTWESVDFPMLPGAGCTASAWIRTRDLGDGGARIYVACFSSEGKWVGTVAHSETVSGTSDWRQVTIQVPPGKCPADTAVVRVDLALRNAPQGIAWFDDVTFSVTQE